MVSLPSMITEVTGVLRSKLIACQVGVRRQMTGRAKPENTGSRQARDSARGPLRPGGEGDNQATAAAQESGADGMSMKQ